MSFDENGRIDFAEAKRRLVHLLVTIGWPSEIAWIDESHIVTFPRRSFIFLPKGRFQAEQIAREKYEAAAATCVAVRVGAIGTLREMTVAAVWPIIELGQGEAMFIDRGLKVNALSEHVVTSTSSRLKWWLIRRRYSRWIALRDAMLRAE